MARDTVEPKPPNKHEKCYARAVNQPGWLTVTTYTAGGGGTCVVDGSGEEHWVVVASDSPLPYFINVHGTCVTDGVAYRDGNDYGKEWTPNPLHLAGRKRGSAVRRGIRQPLHLVDTKDDETLQVTVSWDCITHAGQGAMPQPLILQVDTRTVTRT